MKSLLKLLLISFFVFGCGVNIVMAQTPTPTVQEVNSYELFWPVVAGRVMGEPMYSLKAFKENIRGLLMSGSRKKFSYNVQLAEKRAVEAEKLYLVDKKYPEAEKTLQILQNKISQANKNYQIAESDGGSVADLKSTFKLSLEKQQKLLTYLSAKIPQDNVTKVKESLAQIEELLLKFK